MDDYLSALIDHDAESSALFHESQFERRVLEEQDELNDFSDGTPEFLEGYDFRDMVKHDLRLVIRTAVRNAENFANKKGMSRDSDFYHSLEYILGEAVEEGVHDYFYQRGYNDE